METPQSTSQHSRWNWSTASGFLKKYWRDYLTLFLLSGIIIGLDQWTKVMVRTYIPLGGDWLPDQLSWLQPYARIRHWYNTGAAFGIFQNGGAIFATLAVIVSILILYYFPHASRQDWWLRLAMAMQFGGAIGNLLDRLFFDGRVTDFISISNFAVFNVADSSISVGVVVLLLGVWFKEREEKKQALVGSIPGKDSKMKSPMGEDKLNGG